MELPEVKALNLPDAPGVYYFIRHDEGEEILYVGKATSLRDRVRSYFSRDLMNTRGPLLVKMVEEATAIDFTSTTPFAISGASVSKSFSRNLG